MQSRTSPCQQSAERHGLIKEEDPSHKPVIHSEVLATEQTSIQSSRQVIDCIITTQHCTTCPPVCLTVNTVHRISVFSSQPGGFYKLKDSTAEKCNGWVKVMDGLSWAGWRNALLET
jgi:hypothetical protein